MKEALKKNVWMTGMLMLIAAILCLPLIFIHEIGSILVFCGVVEASRYGGVPDSVVDFLAMTVFFVYGIFCLFVLIYGSSKVIWKLSFKRVWRIVLLFAWLILYPIWCWLWSIFCVFAYMAHNHIH